MAKLVIWNEAKAKEELSKRLQAAKKAKENWERIWRQDEQTVFGSKDDDAVGVAIQSKLDLIREDEIMDSTSVTNVNYVLRDVRMIHSNMSANPPSVIPRPTSPDYSDRKSADAADRLVRHCMRQYNIPEIFDRSNLSVIVRGTGIIKGIWNPDAGEILEYNEETNDILMEGDYEVSEVSPWNFFPDPDASVQEKIQWAFEKVPLYIEEAVRMSPDKEEEIIKCQRKNDNQESNVIQVYQYWEKGAPHNGMQGRFGWCLEDGTPLTQIKPNPHNFSNKKKGTPGIARLPYHICTDIDKLGTYWGYSVVHYSAELQKAVNQIDNVSMDCAKAHGIPRLILPEGTDIKDDSITNSPWDIIKTTGQRDPHFMEPMPMSAVMNTMRERFAGDIMQMDGVNESIYGNQSREQAASLMQYATQQSNMTRKRLFNKYVKQVESVYKDFLDIVKDKWNTKRQILVLGKEKAFEAADIQGSDIEGGFDLVVEYGSSLSLDPMMRREEIMQMMPVLEKAGVPMRSILGMMKLNDLERAYDMVQLAEDRQREIFDEMVTSGLYIEPEEMQDHKNYLEFSYQYCNFSEYKYLTPEAKQLIIRHIKAREELMASKAAPAVGAPGEASSPAPTPEGSPTVPQSLMGLLGG